MKNEVPMRSLIYYNQLICFPFWTTDDLELQSEQLKDENEQLGDEKAAATTSERYLWRKKACLSATFVS
jgi:hypothetical protein